MDTDVNYNEGISDTFIYGTEVNDVLLVINCSMRCEILRRSMRVRMHIRVLRGRGSVLRT